jgi:Putative prokaryotic signal transducing protein
MITIARFLDPQSAELARMALEASGIPVFLESQGVAQLAYAVAVGGVRVRVPPSHADDARAILKSLAEEHGAELY